jgi:uncharacterized Tic20 family protein
MNDQTNPGKSLMGEERMPAYVPTSDERTMAILCHVLTLFFWILPPLIIYLLKKDESSFVAEHAKESMNFQITWAIIGLVLLITLIGILLLWVVGIIVLVLVIVATIKASESKLYRYPFTLRLIK